MDAWQKTPAFGASDPDMKRVSIAPLMVLFCAWLYSLPSWAERGQNSSEIAMAIFGDSLATGAATHPALQFDTLVLWQIFQGSTSLIPRKAQLPADFQEEAQLERLLPPRRLWPSPREFYGGTDWIWRNALQSLSRAYLDTAEYSWGYMTGLKLGVAPHQIALASEDGARVERLPRQIDRLIDATEGILPKRLFVFFTGNDLCAMNAEGMTSSEEFGSDLYRGLRYLAKNGRVGPEGSDVYVLSYLSVMQLLTSDSILNKKVHAFGDETTCRELKANGFRPKVTPAVQALPEDAWFFAAFMPPNPAGFCPTLFAPKGESEKKQEKRFGIVANRIRDFREEQAKVVGRLAREFSQEKLRFHLVEDTAGIQFQGDDIGGDCFHLSVSGQAKVARAVLAFISRQALQR